MFSRNETPSDAQIKELLAVRPRTVLKFLGVKEPLHGRFIVSPQLCNPVPYPAGHKIGRQMTASAVKARNIYSPRVRTPGCVATSSKARRSSMRTAFRNWPTRPLLCCQIRCCSPLDMEESVQASSLNWCILRGGLFYGPDTFAGGCRDAARQGTLSLPGEGSGRLSLIHIADMAQAVVLAAESAPARSIYNVVDNQPVTYKELFEYTAALESGPVPAAGGQPFLPSFACRNDRLKAALGWAPAYPTYRSGLA